MILNINLHKNSDNCQIKYETIEWKKVSDHLWYGNFKLKSDKYINVEIVNNYSNSISVDCTPIIWTKDSENKILELKDLNYKDYINNKDYWYTELEFLLPEKVYPHSYTITPLKGEYEIWVVGATFEEYVKLKSKEQEDLQINIIQNTKDK